MLPTVNFLKLFHRLNIRRYGDPFPSFRNRREERGVPV